jgi:hypothetical protein
VHIAQNQKAPNKTESEKKEKKTHSVCASWFSVDNRVEHSDGAQGPDPILDVVSHRADLCSASLDPARRSKQTSKMFAGCVLSPSVD